MNRWLAFAPLAVLAALALLFGVYGLNHDPKVEPRALVGKPLPEVSLPSLDDGRPVRLADAARGPVLVNVFASWCVPCRQEHPVLMELAKRGDIRLVGINNKDDPANARRFLGALGQPFAAVGSDRDGRVTIDWGGYGVPETFVVDGKGIIRHKHVGPLTLDEIKGTFAAQIEAAKIDAAQTPAP